MKVAFVVATGMNGVIGKDNKLPWRMPADLAHFKRITDGKIVVVGRKTFESIPNGLPGRKKIIFTRSKAASLRARIPYMTEDPAIAIVESREAYSRIAPWTRPEVMVIGGAEIYKLFEEDVTRIYLTKIYEDFEGDTYFEMPPGDWECTSIEEYEPDEKNPHRYAFLTYERY